MASRMTKMPKSVIGEICLYLMNCNAAFRKRPGAIKRTLYMSSAPVLLPALRNLWLEHGTAKCIYGVYRP